MLGANGLPLANDDEGDPNANALRGAAAAAAPFPSRLERGASSINVRDFRADQDDFEQWVKLFEKAVKLATNVRDLATLRDLFLEWLPLKLHSTAYVTYLQATKTTWPELKEELIGLFIDPQERYKWQAKFTTIKWDGKESFHNLAARVVQAVNRYDKEMPDEFKKREYFLRFRSAFKKPMRRIIDMGCPANNRSLEMAKEVALRYQLSTADDDGEATENDPAKGVAFASANLHPDRATSLETAMAGVTTQLENMSISMRRMSDSFDAFDRRISALERAPRQTNQGGDYQSNPRSNYPSGDRGRNNNRGYNQGPQNQGGPRNNRSWSRGSNNSRSNSNNRGDRRNDDPRNDDRRSDDRRNDDRRGNNQPSRRDDDRRGYGNQRSDDRNNQRGQPREDRNDQRNQPRDNRRNLRDNGNRGRDDHSNRNDQYRAIETADEDTEGSDEEEPQGASGYSRGN